MPSPQLSELLEQIRQLPKQERAELRAELDELEFEESAADMDPGLRAELELRLRSIEDGTASLVKGDEVFAKLRSKYAAR